MFSQGFWNRIWVSTGRVIFGRPTVPLRPEPAMVVSSSFLTHSNTTAVPAVREKVKVLRTSSPVAEIVSGAATYVLHTSRDPQRPYNEQSENPKNIRTNIQENPYGLALSIVLWSCLFSLKQESPALTSISSCWDYCL